jgi:hypothetical protein
MFKICAAAREDVGGFSSMIGDPTENSQDERDILADKDQVLGQDPSKEDPSAVRGQMSGSVEDEPDDFVRGEIDVVTAIDRTMRDYDDDLRGLSRRSAKEDDRIPNP